MGILAKIFNATPREQLKGISLGQDAFWELSPARDLASFLKALPSLLPNGAIAYLEDGTPPKEIKTFLDAHCVPEVSHLAMGTIWPRPEVYHLPATPQNLAQLATLAEKCATPEVAIHLHIYQPGKVLLEWYDAFSGDPFYLSQTIPEEKVKRFCKLLSLTYKKSGKSVEPTLHPQPTRADARLFCG